MSKNLVSRVVPVECVYDPMRDLQEVDQFGFVDLADAFDKGILPGSVDLIDESFNGVQNPGTLISRAQDVFDGLRKADYVRRALDKLSAEDRERVEKAVEKSVESAGENVTS